MMFCRCCFVLILLFTWSSAHNDFFTSIGQMTKLLFMEKDLVSSLKDYIRAEEHKLEQIKKWADRLDVLLPDATQDPEGFLGHPVNAFKLMRRLNTEWRELESLVHRKNKSFISNLTNQRKKFPNKNDQTGAAKALMRLQDTYQLDTNIISTGELPGSSSVASLTVDDCFDVGKVAYLEADYYHAELWLVQALKQLDQGETPGLVDAVTVLYYLSSSVNKQGEVERALNFTKRLLELDPTHQRASGNLKLLENLVEKRKYKQLCRGEGILMTPRRQSSLFCRYYDNNRHPRYVIGPVRQEDEWDHPRIVRYHNIVSDKEMEKVKELAKPRLHRSQVAGRKTIPDRISQSAFLRAYEDPVLDKIDQRIEDITGLDITTAEDLQVANYGIGGQYKPHFDFEVNGELDAFKELGSGNRIATWLLYMSDVPAGGATVFTNIGAAVRPIKGTAVFWYNLYSSGKGDNRTRHAACPVLVGSKWVSAKWIHERGQEFRRRCGLQETD
ncbi:prolyl 4-hydroxylase subunit alpha-1-like [Amphiprion ocellaris]|uniref:prolyl 4-hydroxylase subunit alpha-1-like n=1 Tax=Amphiprion ocellaris TaxID=80972 RepID=UPI0024112059|nr:prolyl 4-hydroxylase subunit alpha-1-like [Amphiprion ocellaris]